MRRMKDLTNFRNDKIIAKYPTYKREKASIIWMCDCDCGNKNVEIPAYKLTSHSVKPRSLGLGM